MSRGALRDLPAVDVLLQRPELAGWLEVLPRPLVADAVRQAVAEARTRIRRGEPGPSPGALAEWAADRLATYRRRQLGPVLNVTGVVLHTNLGRAPLSAGALEAVARVSRGYSNLEYEVEEGRRGSRHLHGESLLRHLTGAEAAMVVNNNAAAVLLVLAALAAGREVIVSRGELVEIGGSFRIPDVLAQSGCRLREVGTTNRTHLHDYEEAVGPDTAALLKVHTSNYRIAGFTASVPAGELAPLARARGVLLAVDLGSGALLDTRPFGLGHEPTAQEALRAGADLVTLSGDKLLGGPQAGIILGRAELVARLRRHPLARALRVDKMTLAALAATLEAYLRGRALQEIPVWRMLALSPEEIGKRAAAVARAVHERVPGCRLEVVEGRSAVGGGSLPGETLPTRLLAVEAAGGGLPALGGMAQALAARLRRGAPPVVARIEDGRLVCDLRTLAPEDDPGLAAALAAALAAPVPNGSGGEG